MSDSKPAQSSVWKAAKPFINGGLSGMAATCIIQPVDMVKVRLQIGAKGSPVSFVFSPPNLFQLWMQRRCGLVYSWVSMPMSLCHGTMCCLLSDVVLISDTVDWREFYLA